MLIHIDESVYIYSLWKKKSISALLLLSNIRFANVPGVLTAPNILNANKNENAFSQLRL